MYRLPLLIAALIAIIFVRALFSGDPTHVPSPLVGQAVPDLTLPRLLGDGTVTTADFKVGQVMVLNVWASWCVPCRDEHPHLMRLHQQGVPVIGLNYKDAPAVARRFLARLGNPYRKIGVDDKGTAALMLGVYGVPESFIIDADGRIVARLVGALDAARIAAHITPLLQQP